MLEVIVDDISFNMQDDLKNPLVERVCPICRTFGKNIKFMDLHDDNIKISLTIATCLTCRAVYSMDCEPEKDEKPIP